VRPGETLSSIAAGANTTVAAIVDANGISNPNLIGIGAVLKVPGGSGILCPVPGAKFSNDFGMPRSGGRWHEGNDLFVPKGTPVQAPVSGTVEYLTGELSGLQFRLVTPGGTYFVGSHLSKAGESGSVSAGDIIGYVGNTGNAAGGPAHLHFEIHPNGGPAVNPYPTVVAAC
jgi:murein DD-endopeptidase MepM/ murein hydrolase activator NlpD